MKKPSARILICLFAMLPAIAPAAAQAPSADPFRGLAAGPYKRLVILNAMVIPGHGGPAAGPSTPERFCSPDASPEPV